jgi:hypothetical protein
MSFKKLAVAFSSILLLAASRIFLASPSKDTLTVSAGSATTLTGPTVVGANFDYVYTLPCSPSAFSDQIPVTLTVANGNTAGDSYTIGTSGDIGVSFTGDPGIVSAASLDSSSATSVSDDGTSVTIYIDINASSLTNSTYELNVLIQPSASLNSKLSGPNPNNIHVQLTVTPGSCVPNPNCFLTDSEFDLLTDCSGASVTSSMGGTFAVVANHHNVIVSTNPGEFYYNMLWANTGSTPETVVFTPANPVNASPVGANAVHALTFDSTTFTQNLSNFDMVNQDGTPCGPVGPCTITVPAGNILWVTWHFEYSRIGMPAAGLSTSCSGTCSALASIGVTGTLTLPDLTPVATCSASACGYLKH